MIEFDYILFYIRDFIAAIGVAVICYGALRSLYQFYLYFTKQNITEGYIRLKFGESIILGLEFMVGADIIVSLVQPDYYNLGLLAIIVIIRTILSFFLSKELEQLKSA